MDYVTRADMQAALGRTIDDAEWEQVQGLLRRAARELTLLVGELAQYDRQLVVDTLVDAIREDVENPERLRMEQDGSYSYQRFALPSGLEGRFWWPINLRDLFGLPSDRGRIRVARMGFSPHGWVR